MNVLVRLRRLARPLLAVAVVAAVAVLTAGSAHAAGLVQGTPLDPADQATIAQLLDLLDTLGRLAPLAALVVPLTEVRRLFGGLPDVPLPGGQSISAGRWVSWLVAGALLGIGYALGWVAGPSPDVPFALWLGSRWAILGILANVIYDRWFAPKPAPAPVVVEGRVAARA